MAHDPHDPISAVAVSPNYVNDQTVFAATSYLSLKIDVVALFESTDGGLTWSPVAGLPKDSLIQAIVFSPAYSQDQTIYVAGSGGLFQSTDQGTSWTLSTGTSLESVALSPNFATDNTLFIVTSQKTILESTNRGQTWTTLPAPGPLTDGLTLIAVSPNYAADQTLILGTAANGIFKSTNGGANWTHVTPSLRSKVTALAFSPGFKSDRTAFAATFGRGVLISTNGGSSWKASNSGITDLRATSLALPSQYAQDSTVWITTAVKGVFQSTTAGASWNSPSTVSRPLSSLTTVHYQTVASALGSSGPLLYLGMYEGLWTSINAGASWRYINTLPTSLVRYINVSPNFQNDQTVFASTYGSGNLWSVTGGASWTFQNTGMQLPYTDASAISPNFASDGIAFSGNDGGLQRTSNSGASWQMMVGVGVPAYPRALAVSPAFATDSTVLIGLAATVGGSGVPMPCPPMVPGTSRAETNTGVYLSTDGGNTWVATSLSGATEIFSIAISPAFSSDRTAFAASQSTGLYQSTDGGMTWTSVAKVPSKQLGIVALSPSFHTDGTMFAAGIHGGIFRSTNSGSTWSTLSGTSSLRVLGLEVSPNYLADQTLFAGTIQQGLVKFTGGGATMVPVTSFPDVMVSAIGISPYFASDQTLFAAAYHGVFKSTDGGNTWTNTGAPARVEESQNITGPLQEPPTIIFQGAWSDVMQSPVASTSAYMLTSESGDTLLFSFTGAGVAWVSWTGPNQGSASVQLDGVSQGSLSLNATVDLYQQLVWQIQGLTCGPHALSITAQPQSAGQTVSLDAFNVYGCPP